jgi:type VI secretion system protein ImpE
MTPLELFREGKLTEAVREQDRLVASHPDDAAARLLLAELRLYDGDLDSVRNALRAFPAAPQDMDDYLKDFAQLLRAENARRRILTRTSADEGPCFLLDPPEHLTYRIAALEELQRGPAAQSVDWLDRADALALEVDGHVDGRVFHSVRDCDDLFASLLEVFVDGRYVWFPFDQISRLRLGPRESLRDEMYVPANLRAVSGEEWQVYLPALYPGSHHHPDDEVRGGQATDWHAEEAGPTRGVGLRLLNFDSEELTLLDFTQWEH